MEKEEVLAKAQAEKKDEREMFIVDRSMRWTYLAMAVTTGIFMIIRSVRDMFTTDLAAVVCISAASGFIYRFIKTKEKWYLALGVVLFASGLLNAVLFLCN